MWFIQRYYLHEIHFRKGHLYMQRSPVKREAQEQTAWRVLVVGVLFNDVRSNASLLNLLSADVSFNDTPKRMTTELEFSGGQLISYT